MLHGAIFLATCNAIHHSRVELHCKLQEKLHRVTWPLVVSDFKNTKAVQSFIVCQDIGCPKKPENYSNHLLLNLNALPHS
jgi:hypothetical protein